MPWESLSLPLLLPAFALVLFRIGGLMVLAPMLGSRAIPARIRIALALTISATIFPIVLRQVPASLTVPDALVGVAGELMIGLSMGMACALVLVGVELGGMLIGQQAGMALAQVFNPLIDRQSTAMGQLYFFVTLAAFLLVGGHRALISALLDTFETIPLLSFGSSESVVMLEVEALGGAFILAVKLAGPALIALFLASVSLGFLSRTMPQLHILSIGFPIRSLVALAVAGLSLSFAGDVLVDAITDCLDLLRDAFGTAVAVIVRS